MGWSGGSENNNHQMPQQASREGDRVLESQRADRLTMCWEQRTMSK